MHKNSTNALHIQVKVHEFTRMTYNDVLLAMIKWNVIGLNEDIIRASVSASQPAS